MNILRTWGGLISSLLLSSLLWVMPAAAQSQHFEVKLAVRQTPVNLDSLGRDYTLSGGMQLGAGQPVVHAEVYAWQGALSPVEVTDLEYTPVDFEVARYPEWLSLPSPATASVADGRGERLLRVQIPAFQYKDGVLYQLKRFRVKQADKTRNTRSVVSKATPADYTRVTESQLSSGRWWRFRIEETGVYKITYDELRRLGVTAPAALSVWGGEPHQLPYDNATPNVDDLQQIPVRWVTRDGIPRSGDYALFFLEGPAWWEYNPAQAMYDYHEHDYERHAHYFFTTDRPAMDLPVVESPAPTRRQADYIGLWGTIGRKTNLRYSGREYFGDPFDFTTERTYSPSSLGRGVVGSPARCFVRLAASSKRTTRYDISVAGHPVTTLELAPSFLNDSELATVDEVRGAFDLPAEQVALTIRFQRAGYSSSGWLSRLWINARQTFPERVSQLPFFVDREGTSATYTAFDFPSYAPEVELWNVTRLFHPWQYVSREGATAQPGDQLVLFDRRAARSITVEGEVANQNLHGLEVPELLIVTHERFLSQAEAIADIYRHSPLVLYKDIKVVTAEAVYNEFSSGNRDVSAIRNFARFLYWRDGGATGRFHHLLLVGKPYYELRERWDDYNLLPNYQSFNSVSAYYSFGSDDIFGFLDPDETPERGALDIGVGRYAVKRGEEMDILLRRERIYHTPAHWGTWLTRAVMLADDEDALSYMIGSDSLAVRIEKERKDIEVKRLYVDAFRQENLWHRSYYPAVNQALNREMNHGAYLLNYVGHGSTRKLGHEEFFSFEDAAAWRNLDRLPILVAASCFFASNDWEQDVTLGRDMLLMPQGGSIAIVAAARLTYNYSNQLFNSHLLRSIFPSAKATQYHALGDAVRVAKNRTPGIENRSKYALLGNPALPLPNFSAKMQLVGLNDAPLRGLADTLRAGQKVTCEVSVTLADGSPLEGEAYLQVRGAQQTIRTRNNDGEGAFEYPERPYTLFRGKATCSAGKARFSFVVPTDMDLNYGEGLASMLAQSDRQLASGGYDQFVVGGRVSSTEITDHEGPSVELFWDDYARRSASTVNSNALLIVRLRDSSGINISGAGVGHALMATLIHAGREEQIVLNDFYVAAKDSYQEGEVRYHFSNLSAGKYTLRVAASDVYNNRSEKEINFEVGNPAEAQIANLLNYPNPFTAGTNFYFDGTRPGQAAEVMIQIYTPDGLLVRTLHFSEPSPGLRLGPYYWDGRDDLGNTIGRGVYFYRVRLRYLGNWVENGAATERYEKLLKL